MNAVLGRLGGVFIHPRRTLTAVLRGEGSLFEVLPWFVLVAMTMAPTQAGQSVLLGRQNPIDGVQALLGLFANRVGGPVIAAVIGAAVLIAIDRIRPNRKRSLSFDRSLDACMYGLTPFLALAAVGAILHATGYGLWFMPHRLLRGRGWYFGARFAVAYAWPICLFGVMAWSVFKGVAEDVPDEVTADDD